MQAKLTTICSKSERGVNTSANAFASLLFSMAVWQVVHEHELAAQREGAEEDGEEDGTGVGVVEIEQ